jgi:hypothetical protein
MTILRVEHDLDIAKFDFGVDVESTILVRYVTAKTDTREQVISDSLYIGNYGANVSSVAGRDLYVHKSNLIRSGEDFHVAWWDSEIDVSSVQPPRPGLDPNPLSRPVRRLKWESTRESFPSVVDHRGRAARNTAGDFFGGFEREVQLKKFFFVMNYASPPAWAFFLDGAVNSEEITVVGVTMPPGTVKLYVPDGPLEPIIEGGVSYYQINYELHFNPMGHQTLFWNTGYQELSYTDSNGDRVSPTAAEGDSPGQLKYVKSRACRDDQGEPVKSQVFLDAYGRKIKSKHLRPKTAAVGNANITKNTVYATATNFAITEDDIGLCVGFRHAVPQSHPHLFVSEIVSFSGSTFEVRDKLPWTTLATVFVPGTTAVSLANAPECDFVAAGIPF